MISIRPKRQEIARFSLLKIQYVAQSVLFIDLQLLHGVHKERSSAGLYSKLPRQKQKLLRVGPSEI